jgi:hypothetical protein
LPFSATGITETTPAGLIEAILPPLLPVRVVSVIHRSLG